MFLVQQAMNYMITGRRWAFASIGVLSASLLTDVALAQNYPITQEQRETATQVAQNGVPLSELTATAPDAYTVKSGDTLWGISGIYLARPWRWPELWGMNLQQIRNPHLIYPGQQLYLLKKDGRAILSTVKPGSDGQTVRVSPRTRFESLADAALTTLSPRLIEPYLAEPLVVEQTTLLTAPRIVAAPESRVMLSRGDRAYARGPSDAPVMEAADKPYDFRVVRDAVALKDPLTAEILGYEAQYLGKALLVRGESKVDTPGKEGKTVSELVPASLDIISTKEEIRVGDRLLPEPPRELLSYVPHAPTQSVDARVVSIYGSGFANANAAQSQVVVINKGTRDGIERGHVLAVLSAGDRIVDKTDPAKPFIRLPDENNGLLMVFRPFEKVSYGLLLEIKSGVKVGDRLVTPR